MWEDLFAVLPREIVNHLRLITGEITEIRIRRGAPLCVTLLNHNGNSRSFSNCELGIVTDDNMMKNVMAALTDDALYLHENTLKDGYITAQGCYRVGVIGRAVCEADRIVSLQSVDGINIRLWREITRIADEIYRYIEKNGFSVSVLILSLPGMGKTTVLRDLAISLTQRYPNKKVALIDSRSEVATPRMASLSHLDIMKNYPKARGIEIATRVMSPEYILCDEIGMLDEIDSMALLQQSGVPAIMTAHAGSVDDLMTKAVFRTWHERRVFDLYVKIEGILSNGKSELSLIPRDEVRLLC